jgi:hypothetical protein
MESCIQISLSEYIDPDQSQRFDHSGRNEIWREPFPPARTCDTGATNVKVGPPVVAKGAKVQLRRCITSKSWQLPLKGNSLKRGPRYI